MRYCFVSQNTRVLCEHGLNQPYHSILLPFHSGRTERKGDFPSSQMRYVEICGSTESWMCSKHKTIHQLLRRSLLVEQEMLAFRTASAQSFRVNIRSHLPQTSVKKTSDAFHLWIILVVIQQHKLLSRCIMHSQNKYRLKQMFQCIQLC